MNYIWAVAGGVIEKKLRRLKIKSKSLLLFLLNIFSGEKQHRFLLLHFPGK